MTRLPDPARLHRRRLLLGVAFAAVFLLPFLSGDGIGTSVIAAAFVVGLLDQLFPPGDGLSCGLG